MQGNFDDAGWIACEEELTQQFGILAVKIVQCLVGGAITMVINPLPINGIVTNNNYK